MRIAFWIIYIAFLLTQAFIVYHFIRVGNKIYLKSVLITNILFGLYVAADEIFGIGVPYLLRILVVVTLFVHNFIGYYLKRYTRSMMFDRYLHAGGSFAFALFLYSFLSLLTGGSAAPRLFAAVMVAFTGIAAGAVFEIDEFFIDQRAGIEAQRSLKDTMTDLICDVIGSALAAVAAFFFML